MPKEFYKAEVKGELEKQVYCVEDATPLTYEEIQQLEFQKQKEVMERAGMTTQELRGYQAEKEKEYQLQQEYYEEALRAPTFIEDAVREKFAKDFTAWQNMESQKKGTKFGPGFFLRNDPDLYWHVRLHQNGEFEQYLSPEMREVWYQSQEISKASGMILQYAVENVLKLAGNRNLIIEKSFQRKRPDLVRIDNDVPLFLILNYHQVRRVLRKT